MKNSSPLVEDEALTSPRELYDSLWKGTEKETGAGKGTGVETEGRNWTTLKRIQTLSLIRLLITSTDP